MAETKTLADLKHDPKNARVHTPRTIGSIVDSIHVAGVGRGIVIDENDVILAGNGTVEAALEALGEDAKVVVVEQDKAALTVVKRTGLSPAQRVRLALDDNRAAEHSRFDPDVLKELAGSIEDIGDLFTPVELTLATAPITDERPAPVSRYVEHSNRQPTLKIGGLTIGLSSEQNILIDQLTLAWVDRYGSTAGLGGALAAAFIEVIDADPRVQAFEAAEGATNGEA